ncbi:MAG: helix-hairpin-helix domain-containing protein [Candidatus Krumholzibacteriia bacterium]
MNRREATGLLLLAALVLAGRLIRTQLLLGPDGAWRDPLWLEQALPPLPEEPPPPPRLAGPLDPNTAPPESLVLLPGIGPALAGRIVEARNQGVQFATSEDLRQVRGIGPVLAGRLADRLVFPPVPAAAADCTSAGAGAASTPADSISSCNALRR